MQVKRGGHRAGVFTHEIERGRRQPEVLVSLHPRRRPCRLRDGDLRDGAGQRTLHQPASPHRSLENHSDKVRWSVDLRWQRPGEPAGWKAISISWRCAAGTDPAFRPDWDGFFAQRAKAFEGFRDLDENSFDISVEGPWIDRWR